MLKTNNVKIYTQYDRCKNIILVLRLEVRESREISPIEYDGDLNVIKTNKKNIESNVNKLIEN